MLHGLSCTTSTMHSREPQLCATNKTSTPTGQKCSIGMLSFSLKVTSAPRCPAACTLKQVCWSSSCVLSTNFIAYVIAKFSTMVMQSAMSALSWCNMVAHHASQKLSSTSEQPECKMQSQLFSSLQLATVCNCFTAAAGMISLTALARKWLYHCLTNLKQYQGKIQKDQPDASCLSLKRTTITW